MKKKYWVIILMSLFFLATSAFHFDGTNNHANANKDVNGLDSKDNNEEEVNGRSDDEPINEDQRIDLISENSSQTTENQPENYPEVPNEQTDQENKPNQQDSLDSDPSTSKNETVDNITINGSVYKLIMDEKQYPNLVAYIEVARQHEAKLYGIPDSDVLAIIKDGEQIASMSTGVRGVLPKYVDVVRGLFSEEYKGIQDNIDLVLETGATVTVVFPNSNVGYSIELREEYLVINY